MKVKKAMMVVLVMVDVSDGDTGVCGQYEQCIQTCMWTRTYVYVYIR